MIEVDENEETLDIEEELDEIDKKFDEVRGANWNAINNNMIGSQLMTFRMNVIQLRMLWKLRLKLKLIHILRSMLNK